MVAGKVKANRDWVADAACFGIEYLGSDNPFFAEGHGQRYIFARNFCSHCPVVVDCLIEGLSIADTVGMWGCTSKNERKNIRIGIRKGKTLKSVTEKVWEYHRKGKWENKVPSPQVWIGRKEREDV